MTRWNSKIQFPTDSNFILRITDAKFGPSKGSGNPMITVEFEVVQPEVADVGGEQVDISGVTCTNYYVTKVLDKDGNVDEDATKECFKRIFVSDQSDRPALFQVLGFDGAKENTENPDVKKFKGLLVYAQMSPDVVEQRKNPTSVQIAEAKKSNRRAEGDIMKHPVTGKNLINYWPKVRDIYGIAPSKAAGNKPY